MRARDSGSSPPPDLRRTAERSSCRPLQYEREEFDRT